MVVRISNECVEVENGLIELQGSQKYFSDYSMLLSLIFRRNLKRLIYELYGGKVKVIWGDKSLINEWIDDLAFGNIKSYLEIGAGFSTYPKEIVDKMASKTKVLIIDKNPDAIRYQKINFRNYSFVELVTDEISSRNIRSYTSYPFDLCVLSKVLPYIKTEEREKILKVVTKNCKRVVVMSYCEESGIEYKWRLFGNSLTPQEISNSLTNLKNYFSENKLSYLIMMNRLPKFNRLNIFTRNRYL